MTVAQPLLTTTQSGRVLTITINNPPANFLTSAIMADLNRQLKAIERRTDIGAVILTGAVEGVFVTHFDVDEIEKAVQSIPFPMSTGMAAALSAIERFLSHVPGARRLLSFTPMAGVSDMNVFHEVTARMRAMNKVFIAAINGRAMGGGCELALACDVRLMADADEKNNTMIGQPEILLGLIPGGGGTQMLTRSLGVAKALAHCLEGHPLTPAQALELGMVTAVVPGPELLPASMDMARRLARRSPQAVRSIKHAIYQASAKGWDSGMTDEKNAFLSAASQPNTRRGMRSYISQLRTQLATGRQLEIDDFSELIEGTATDMTS